MDRKVWFVSPGAIVNLLCRQSVPLMCTFVSFPSTSYIVLRSKARVGRRMIGSLCSTTVRALHTRVVGPLDYRIAATLAFPALRPSCPSALTPLPSAHHPFNASGRTFRRLLQGVSSSSVTQGLCDALCLSSQRWRRRGSG